MAEPLRAQHANRILRLVLANMLAKDPNFAASRPPRKMTAHGPQTVWEQAADAAEVLITRQFPHTPEGNDALVADVEARIRRLDPDIIDIAEVVPAAKAILDETRQRGQELRSQAAIAAVGSKVGLATPPVTTPFGPQEELSPITPTPSPTPDTTQTTLDMVKRMMEEPSYGLSLLLDAANAMSGTKAGTAEFLAAQAKISSLGVIFDAAQKLQANRDKMLAGSVAEQHYLDEQQRKSIESIQAESRFGQGLEVTKRGQDITAAGQTLTAQTAAERLQLDTERERQRIIEAQQTLQAEITKTLAERQQGAATVGATLQPFRLPPGTEYNPGFEPNSLMAQQAGSVGLQYSPMRTSSIGVDPNAGVRTIQDYLARLGQTVQ